MRNLLTLIKLEARTRTPFPILEFIPLLFFSTISFQVYFSLKLSSGRVDLIRISIMPSVLTSWAAALRTTLLITGIILAVFISMTFAGEYESSVMMSKLALPIKRSEYLFSKVIFYVAFTFISLTISYILVLFSSPLEISLFRFIQILSLTFSQLILLTSIPLFFAFYGKKNSVSILISLTIELLAYLVFSLLSRNLSTFLSFFFNPSSILTTSKHLEGLIWGVMLPFLIGMALFALIFIKFSEIDIIQGDM